MSRRPVKKSVAQKGAQYATRIRRLRESLGMGKQQDLAAAVHVTQPTVSAWEKGDYPPAADLYIRLGNLAAQYSKLDAALWFWAEVGVHRAMLEKLSPKLAKAMNAEDIKFQEWLLEKGRSKEQKAGGSSLAFYIFDRYVNDLALEEKNLVRLDVSATDVKSLLDKIALVEISLPDSPVRHVMGRLRVMPEGREGYWYAVLGPLSDRTKRTMLLGSWKQPDFDSSLLDERLELYELPSELRELQKKACANIQLKTGHRLLGRVLLWADLSGANESEHY